MFLSVLAVFCLYICERVHSLSVINLDDYSSSFHHLQNHRYSHNRQQPLSSHLSDTLFAAPTRTAAIIRSQPSPKTRKAFIDRTFYPQLAPSTIEDLLSKEKDLSSENNNNNNNIFYNAKDDNYSSSSSLDYGTAIQPVIQSYHSSSLAEQPESLSSTSGPPFAEDLSSNNDIEKIELHTNNHQSMNGASSSLFNITGVGGSHNSRHYYNTIYHGGHPMKNSPHMSHSAQYGGKYGPPSSSMANAFANNINLNYIHNLLSNKPLGSNAFASLLNFNLNSLPTSAYNTVSSSNNNNNNNNNNNKYMTPYYSTPAPASFQAAPAANQQPVTPTQQPQLQQSSPPPAETASEVIVAKPQELQQITTGAGSTRFAPIDYSGSFGSCGRQQISSREPRIVGGNSTYEGEFPWAVNIQKQGNHHCGGVIVGRRWILTAAHCVRSQLVSNLVVRTGGHPLTRSMNHITSHLSRDYLVDQIVMHDDFSRYDNLTGSQVKLSANTNNADIALLRLKNDIMWNELAWPVCFPHRDSGNFSGHDAVVVGWGKLSEKSEDFSNDLQKVKLTIIDNNICQSWFRQAGRDIPIDDRIICAGFKKGGKDACHGDSGGPLLSKIGGQYVVVGVVSTGIGCARPLLPGLYSRVTSYISWIEKHVTE